MCWGGGYSRSLVFLLVLGILFLFGTSYAIWQINLKQDSSNAISSSCFKINFQDKNMIQLQESYPMTDEEGKKLIPYEFTITNTCNTFAAYQVNLEVLEDSTLENLDFIKVMLDEDIFLLSNKYVVEKTLLNAKTSYKLETGYLRENESITYSLKMWLDETTPTSEEFMEKVFQTKITVIATYKDNFDNNIIVSSVSQNEGYSDSETFSIHITSEKYDIVSMSEDLETWEKLETKGKDITLEKRITSNGNHTFYFQDETGNIKELEIVATKIDDKKPIANMSVTKINNEIYLDASSSKDNQTSISKFYYSKDGMNYEESNDDTYKIIERYEYGKATETLINFEQNQIKTVYLKTEDEVGNISDVKEYDLASDFAYDETIDNNLRYMGANPNNYVLFNDELWRIIGVMNNIYDGTGKKETRIKLIRNEPIGNYSWDSSASGINGGHGINEWSQADVMKLLNPGYEMEVAGGSLYWSRGIGLCYTWQTNKTTACNFSEIGLKESAKMYISQAVWHTGANGTEATYENIITSKMYELERSSNTGKICTSGTECNDKVIRTTTWRGIVGLMHLSDYGYATSGGTTTNRKTCLNTILFYWDGSNVSDCKNNNWLYHSNIYQWTLNPYSFSDRARNVFYINSTGRGGCDIAHNNKNSVVPTVFLKSSIKILSGLGTAQKPFILSL